MPARSDSKQSPIRNRTTAERTSERELTVTRTIHGPARIVFDAWTQPELLRQWWVPKSAGLTLLSCEVDARVGGGYRLVFSVQGTEAAFFGTYLEVVPHARLVWTNDESGEPGQVTTVTFEERDGKTLIVLRELYPSKEALDAAFASGSIAWEIGPDVTSETFDQLEDFVAAQLPNDARS